MYSLETIRSLSREATKKAAKAKKEPYLVEKEDLDRMPPFPFPYLGDYVTPGWELVETFFVDSSGFGKPGEPALTANQFKKKIQAGFGYGLIEVGEFQLYVGKFQKINRGMNSR